MFGFCRLSTSRSSFVFRRSDFVVKKIRCQDFGTTSCMTRYGGFALLFQILSFAFVSQGINLVDLNNPPVSKSAFDCSVCGKFFNRKWDLNKHMNIHFPERGYCCTICDAKFNQPDTLKAHLRRHMPLPSVSCDVCHKSFATSSNLKVHKVRQHPETLDLPIQDENEPDEISGETSAVADAGGSVTDCDRDQVRWGDQGDLSLSILVGKNKKTDHLSDFFVIEKQFDLNSMMSDFFPDDDK